MLESLLVKPYRIRSMLIGPLNIYELAIEKTPVFMAGVIIWELVKE